MDKEHKNPDTIDLEAPRLAPYMHQAWKKHQNTVYRVDINLALKKGLKFYQTRSNAIILHETLPSCCIPRVVRMETGDVIYEKVYASPRPPPKISLKHDWMKALGSEVARQPEGEVARQAKNSQSTEPNPYPIRDRSGEEACIGIVQKLVSALRRNWHRLRLLWSWRRRCVADLVCQMSEQFNWMRWMRQLLTGRVRQTTRVRS